MKFCGHCGKELEGQAKFCPYCGKSLVNTPTNKVSGMNNNLDSIRKIIAVLSAAVLLVLFFFKWFQLPVLRQWGAYLTAGLSLLGGISDLDLSGSYSVWSLALMLIRNFNLVSTFEMNDQVLIIIIVFLFIIVFYLIALVNLIGFISKFVSLSLKNSSKYHTFVEDYNRAMTSSIAMFAAVFLIVLIINTWVSAETEININMIVLDNSFYTGAVIAVISRAISAKLFVLGEPAA
ncbi:MAG: zinc-ribbon domain-containing protein [Oscillospiraceae bacterium]|nr:zinc-ribbon domain-containing protein [Oscillospiraceae bacterium]